MPAAMITDVTGVSAFDVIGCTDEPESNVYHVALATDDQSGLLDGKVRVYEADGHRLYLGQNSPTGESRVNAIQADLVAWLEDGTAEIRELIELWRMNMQDLLVLGQSGYICHPHCRPIHDESGSLVGMRFSCVGLVYEAYLFAGIKLISDLNNLPEMSKEALLAIWPLDDRIVARLEHELGPLPWRPLMPGYVVYAFDAPSRPYTPTIADLRFPRLSTAAPEGDDPGEPTTDAADDEPEPQGRT